MARVRRQLAAGVVELRRLFAEDAFTPEAAGFDVEETPGRGQQYVCPMHPEVTSDEPGSCPRCGMDLVPRETAGGMDQGHPRMDHEHHESMEHGRHQEHGGGSGEHDHMDHGGMGFMSMVEMTKDLARSTTTCRWSGSKRRSARSSLGYPAD